ncbi:MAG: hypothetical protein PHX74_01015 [Candidatus Sumerlaeales bacterium]|nr:hypothetical protein [Candidatus Sumerlaeales bacterium]
MLEQLQLLEDKIAVVAARVNKLRTENATLKTENTQLKQVLQNCQIAEDRVATLNSRLAEQEAMLDQSQKNEAQLNQIIQSISQMLNDVRSELEKTANMRSECK